MRASMVRPRPMTDGSGDAGGGFELTGRAGEGATTRRILLLGDEREMTREALRRLRAAGVDATTEPDAAAASGRDIVLVSAGSAAMVSSLARHAPALLQGDRTVLVVDEPPSHPLAAPMLRMTKRQVRDEGFSGPPRNRQEQRAAGRPPRRHGWTR